jgi:hypothetical protein
MSKKARRFALMGAATGMLQGVMQLAQEAKSERLRQARLAEQQYLLAEQRAYDEHRDDKRAARDDERYERSRADKMTDEERAAEREEARYERQTKDRRSETAEERAFRERMEDKRMASMEKRYGDETKLVTFEMEDGSLVTAPMNEPPEGATKIVYAAGGRFAPTAARVRQPSGGAPAAPTKTPEPVKGIPPGATQAEEKPPIEGAIKAKDGNWYVPNNDPKYPYKRVDF